MRADVPEMTAEDQYFETGSQDGAGQGEWPPSTWATLIFVLALLWLIFVAGAFGER